jgi:hypothetical protein
VPKHNVYFLVRPSFFSELWFAGAPGGRGRAQKTQDRLPICREYRLQALPGNQEKEKRDIHDGGGGGGLATGKFKPLKLTELLCLIILNFSDLESNLTYIENLLIEKNQALGPFFEIDSNLPLGC